MDRLAIFALIAMVTAAFAFLRWRAAVNLFFVLVILDGAIRKWIFPEAQQFLYFLKDFLLVGVYVRFALSSGTSVIPAARSWVSMNLMLAMLVTLAVFNPELPSLTLGIVGWKSYLLYIPLAFVVPHLFRSIDDLMASLRRYAVLALPVMVLAVLQFFVSSDNVLNSGLQDSTGMRTEQAAFHEIDRVRVAGPFPFVSGFTSYLSAMLVCALVLLSGVSKGRATWAIYVVGASCVIGMLMSGSRGPVVTGIAMLALFFAMSVSLGIVNERLIRTMWMSGALVGVAVLWILPDALEAFSSRAGTLEGDVDPVLGRIMGEFTELWRALQEGGALGYGVGATHNAAVSIIDVPGGLWSWLPTIAEGEMARVALELGLIGWMLVYLPRIWIVVLLWREARKARESITAGLLAAICAYLVVTLPTHIMINPVTNVYYYAAIGLAFAALRVAALNPGPAQPYPRALRRSVGARQPG